MLRSSIYTSIPDRRRKHELVRAALDTVIRSDPVILSSEDRANLITGILDDLENDADADATAADVSGGTRGSEWPEDLRCLALETVKVLGRSSSGSEVLGTDTYLRIILSQAGLGPHALPSSPVAFHSDRLKSTKQAISILANSLRLHPQAASSVVKLGGGSAIARILCNSNEVQLDEETVFLLGRCLFLLTAEKDESVRVVVEDGGGMQGLDQRLRSLAPAPSSFMALSESLKVVYNLLVHYPLLKNQEWDDKFDLLLPTLLDLLHALPQDDLLPPITNVINALTRFPFTPSLRATWTRSNARASVKTTPRILFAVLENFFNRNLPPLPWVPGEAVPPNSGLAAVELDEILPASLLVLGKVFEGDEEMRREGMDLLLPSSLDRSVDSIPLEKRPGLLGNLLRVLGAATLPLSSMAVGEMFWALCGKDSNKLCEEIGYGNAAGILFMKGISAPSDPKAEAHVTELSEEEEGSVLTATSTTNEKTSSLPLTTSDTPRDPITSLQLDARPVSSIMADMTQEQKEIEAERMMSLFDRMAQNPAMKVENPMKAAVESGKAEQWDAKHAAEDEARIERKEEEDEKEALRDLQAYKQRKAGGHA